MRKIYAACLPIASGAGRRLFLPATSLFYIILHFILVLYLQKLCSGYIDNVQDFSQATINSSSRLDLKLYCRCLWVDESSFLAALALQHIFGY